MLIDGARRILREGKKAKRAGRSTRGLGLEFGLVISSELGLEVLL